MRHQASGQQISAVIAISQFVKDDIVQFAGVSPDKITVTHEAADPITDARRATARARGQAIHHVRRSPTPHKNLERLIEAFGLLKAQHPELQLVLAGKKDANYQRIESQNQAKGRHIHRLRQRRSA